ncbi:MAG: NTF2-like N-terminal transpeptidase domain-containing protein [Terracidiphilus sp.]
MSSGPLIAAILGGATVALIVVGTIWPVPSAAAYAGRGTLVRSSSTPEAAVANLGDEIRAQAWDKAYASFANKAEFTEQEFIHSLSGAYPGLLTYSTIDNFETRSIHASDNEAEIDLKLHWATVVGNSARTYHLHVVKNGDHWESEWPIVKEPTVPPQVIPVNYLRWDVIYRGPGDDWGAQDAEAPHVRIVDMHPVERADGVVVLGELLNEDVVPAYVSVGATLMSKNQSQIAAEDCFDKISHILLPKQTTPFLIKFSNVTLSQVGSIRMTPQSMLISASADPVVEIGDEQLHPAPDASLTGQLINQSGQIVNVAHVLGTFYDKNGQVVWVADQYVDSALLPQNPVSFDIHIPEDLARNVSTQRTVLATYSSGGSQ